MRNRKKPEPPQEEGSPAWMNTYGDMVTLLLTFFVLLFSFSTIDAQKWEEIVSSLSGTPFVAIQALNPGDVNAETQTIDETTWDQPEPTPVPSDMETVEGMNQAQIAEVRERFDELYDKIKSHVIQNGLQDDLNVEMKEDAILIRMTESALFDSGKAIIKQKAMDMLPTICDIIMEYDSLIQTIRIEGHTDNVPMHSDRFQDNLALSSARANNVQRFIQEIMNINPAKLASIGLSEYHPVASNDTDAGKTRNRRVDFVLESILKK